MKWLLNILQKERLYALPASQRHLMTLILRKLLASSTFAISGTLENLIRRLNGILKENSVNLKQIEELDSTLSEDCELFDEFKMKLKKVKTAMKQ